MEKLIIFRMTENNNRLLFHNRGVPSYYPSNVVGGRIINAMSGVAYDDLVGSKSESNYFRVIEASGRFNHEGFKLPNGCYNPNSNKLFYDSKEEWIRHQKMRKIKVEELYPTLEFDYLED
jgi:hypothetical protein